MADVEDETRQLLENRPGLEDALRKVLRVDEEGPWTFEDIDVDSGTFGEIVSRGFVEERDSGYRLVGSSTVRSVLDGEAVESETGTGRGVSLSGLSRPDIDMSAILALGGALLLVLFARVVFMWNAVFRDGHVVLAGNDPWGYRYYVEQLLSAGVSPFALSSVAEYLAGGIAQDSLYIVVAWWSALLFGGTPHAAGVALAWLPVVSAVVTGLVVYSIALRLTADRRIGLASVVLLALTPVHAFRTAVGFGDHHAFDYLWVVLTAYAIVVIAMESERRCVEIGTRTVSVPSSRSAWTAAVLLGVSVSAQSLAWRAGPLLSLPIGGYALYRAVSDGRVGRSPLADNLPLVIGLAIGAVLTVIPSMLWRWPLSGVRTAAPTLLLCGVIGVLIVGELGYRLDVSPRTVMGSSVAVGAVAFASGWALLPPFSSAVAKFFSYLGRTGESGIAETYSLFSGNLGTVVGPLLFLGLVLYLALPYVGVALLQAYRAHRPAWAAIGIYAVFFLLLASVQVRFAGQLSLFTAVFAGFGFVHLASVVDVLERPQVFDREETPPSRSGQAGGQIRDFEWPSWNTIGYLAVLLVLVGSIGLVQIPVKQGQITTDGDIYRTASWISSHANNSTGQADRYVFSDWSHNRVYNYFLDGDSRSYSYAQQHYGDFTASGEAASWYENLSEKSTQYVVVTPVDSNLSAASMQNRLWQHWGSDGESSSGVSHYRAVYATDDRKVFELVEGATIVGTTDPNASATVSATVTVGETSFAYNRTVEPNPYGVYAVTVPYDGTYTVQEGEVTVSNGAVRNGGRYVTHDRPGTVHLPFDAGEGTTAYDRVSEFTGEIEGATWTDGVNGSALSFDGEDDQVVVDSDAGQGIRAVEPNSSLTVSFWLRGSLEPSSAQYPTILRLENESSGTVFGLWARTGESVEGGVDDFGIAVNDANGTTVRNFGIGTTGFSNWTHVVAVLDREADELRLYQNGSLVKTVDASSLAPLESTGRLTIGSADGRNYAPVTVDNVRVFDRALEGEGVGKL